MWGNTVARKNHMGKYCSNSQCFFQEKNYKTKLLPAQYEKTKIDKDNSRKKQRKQKKKTIWGNTVTINSILKKKL
jgi:hypothetical protein